MGGLVSAASFAGELRVAIQALSDEAAESRPFKLFPPVLPPKIRTVRIQHAPVRPARSKLVLVMKELLDLSEEDAKRSGLQLEVEEGQIADVYVDMRRWWGEEGHA